MDINKNFISTVNTNKGVNPCTYIVIHETDNTNKGAGAKRHAESQSKGWLTGMSVQLYAGSDGVYQAAPLNSICWHVGKNYVSSPNNPGCTNNNSIGIEICVNSDGDYDKARQNAIELVKHLMKTLNIPASRVIRHFDAKGKYCPRKMLNTPSLWTGFKKQIGNATSEPSPTPTPPTTTNYYRVGTAWNSGICENQIGAFTVLENAKKECLQGYKVFDWDGRVVYENRATGTQSSIFKGLSEADAAEKMLALCLIDSKKSGILPSVSAAQMILESGYGKTELAEKANNCFGMKCTLSGNTWPGTTWDGKSKYNKKTEEQGPDGGSYYIYADFRKYPCIEDSIADHSVYLLGAKNGSKLRYEGLTKKKTYKEQITLIKNGGYATDVKYVDKICNIITRFRLDRHDVEIAGKAPASSTPTPAPAPTLTEKYTVKKGDSLGAIAKKFGVTVDNLVVWNAIKDKNVIYVGQVLLVKKPVTAEPKGKFKVQVSTTNLNIRTGAGTGYKIVRKCPRGIYTITETKSANGHNWGKLLSGEGWIALEYAKKL